VGGGEWNTEGGTGHDGQLKRGKGLGGFRKEGGKPNPSIVALNPRRPGNTRGRCKDFASGAGRREGGKQARENKARGCGGWSRGGLVFQDSPSLGAARRGRGWDEPFEKKDTYEEGLGGQCELIHEHDEIRGKRAKNVGTSPFQRARPCQPEGLLSRRS